MSGKQAKRERLRQRAEHGTSILDAKRAEYQAGYDALLTRLAQQQSDREAWDKLSDEKQREVLDQQRRYRDMSAGRSLRALASAIGTLVYIP